MLHPSPLNVALDTYKYFSVVQAKQVDWFLQVWIFLIFSYWQDRKEREQQDMELAKEMADDDEEEEFP